MADDTAKLAREHLEVPWDELREARVHKRALEAFRSKADLEDEFEDGVPFYDEEDPDFAAEEPTGEEPSCGELDGNSPSDDGHDTDAELLASVVKPIGPQSRWWLMAAALLTAAAAAWFLMPKAPIQERATATWSVASTLRFADGSRSLLGDGAQVEVLKDSPPAVRVKQAAGVVRYEVTPRKQRQFVVTASGVEVTVIGTIFEVSVGARRVNVSVQRGKVRVRQGHRVVELVAGEHITMDASAPSPSRAITPRSTASANDGRVAKRPANAAETSAGDGGAAAQNRPGTGGAGAHPSAEGLLRAADQARASGNLAEAARVLRRLVQLHPRDKRVTVALFTLGKVERQQNHFVQAAQAFEQCGAALRGDALAAAASSWLSAGNAGRARAAAARYLERFPDGVHASAMRGIVH